VCGGGKKKESKPTYHLLRLRTNKKTGMGVKKRNEKYLIVGKQTNAAGTNDKVQTQLFRAFSEERGGVNRGKKNPIRKLFRSTERVMALEGVIRPKVWCMKRGTIHDRASIFENVAEIWGKIVL